MEQKALLCRRLLLHEALERDVRALWAALDDQDADKEQKESARRLWRRGFIAVTALRRWSILGKRSRVLFRLELGGAKAVGVALCGDAAENGEASIKSPSEQRW